MLKKTGLIIIFVLCFAGKLFSQKNENCAQTHMEGYVIDGQKYTLALKGANSGRAYFSFFDGFQYRIAVCSPTHKNYKIVLYDFEKKILFSTSCVNYVEVIDISFVSGMAGFLEITTLGNSVTEPVFNIAVGFKEKKNLIKKKNIK